MAFKRTAVVCSSVPTDNFGYMLVIDNIQGRSQPFLIEGSKLFSKSLLYTARHKFWQQLRKQLATLYNECHLVYDYSHYIVKIKLVTTCAS